MSRSIYRVSLMLMAFITFVTGCKKETSPIPDKPTGFSLSAIRFKSFTLQEAASKSITLEHPVIVNERESKAGVVNITITKRTGGLKLTPETLNVNSDSFTVAPSLGREIDFSDGPVNFTITAKHNTSKQVHYTVTITEEDAPAETSAQITAFKFTVAKNPFLQSDIEAARIIDGEGTLGKIFVFVPLGTDYNELVPTIQYKGAQVYYSTDPATPPAQSTTVYPADGRKTAFKYPAKFYLTVKNGDKVKSYDVVVDIKNPFRFAKADVTTGWVSVGNVGNLDVTGFVNQGNHPATVIAIIHTDRLPAGISAIRANTAVQLGGLLPGGSDDLMANVGGTAATFPAGIYKVKASLQPRFLNYEEADDLLDWSSVNITSEIK
ncbi:MAG: hypothetical protein EOO02_00240 [Chitinophagaceae bacterium]|nr:MAG: hypothetical protein EOO02_00240 [Chitinophagaceae bacterium]